MIELYLKERGDAKIKTQKDLNEKSKPLTDTNPTARGDATRRRMAAEAENNRSPMTLDNANRWLTRFAVQQIVLQAMEDMHLDAMVCPTGNIPPYILGQPLEPTLNGRGPSIWSFLGTQGFPELGVPAGFTTQVYDRVRDASAPGGTRLVDPIPAKLPLSVMFFGRPFSEPTLFRIASAYESATHHRDAAGRTSADLKLGRTGRMGRSGGMVREMAERRVVKTRFAAYPAASCLYLPCASQHQLHRHHSPTAMTARRTPCGRDVWRGRRRRRPPAIAPIAITITSRPVDHPLPDEVHRARRR